MEVDITTFDAAKVFKGPETSAPCTEIATICCICGFKFTAGKKYFVYAGYQLATGRYHVSSCSLSRTFTGSREDELELEVLRRLKKK